VSNVCFKSGVRYRVKNPFLRPAGRHRRDIATENRSLVPYQPKGRAAERLSELRQPF
jgi:hypothetical protein